MSLDLSSLRKAINSLDFAVQFIQLESNMKNLNKDGRNLIKAGVIQNFEFTFELCWKFIQRWIKENKTPQEAEPRTRKELFRLAAKYQLIENPETWFSHADTRNITSHAYDEDKAEVVYQQALTFVADSQYLLQQLEKFND